MARVISVAVALGTILPMIATAEVPLTPILGVSPSSVDFGCVAVGDCLDVTVDLFNDVSDPESVMEITEISVAGGQFALFDAPALPVSVPGGDTTVTVGVRLCPAVKGDALGTLNVVAPDAINSPLGIALRGSTCNPEVALGQFVIKFTSDALLLGPTEGPLEQFLFRYPLLQRALVRADVSHLRRLLPGFKSTQILNELGEQVTLNDMSTIYVASLQKPGESAAYAIANVANREGVVFAEYDVIRTVGFVPDDSLFAHQWGFHNTGAVFQPYAKTDADVEGPQVWELSDGQDVWVAVLDTGIDSTHADLAPRVRNGGNYVEPGSPPSDIRFGGHGTAVAGILAASGNNGVGVAGGAWGATVAAIKVCGPTGTCFGSAIVSGLDEAIARGDAIVNCSFGGPTPLMLTEYDAYENAAKAGKLVVAIMHNDNSNRENYPARSRYLTFAVGAVWLNGLRWDDRLIPKAGEGAGSNYGSWIDVAAPGGRTIATTAFLDPDNHPYHYYFTGEDPDSLSRGFSGTSAAAPVVSGIGALLKSTTPSLDGSDLSEIISRTARDVREHGMGFDDSTGWGIPRADAAWWYVNASSKAVEQDQVTPLVVSQTSETRFFINWDSEGLFGPHPTTIYTLETTINFQTDFIEPPDLWYRISGTVGIHDTTTVDRFEEPPSYAKVLSLGQHQAMVRTFVYFVEDRGRWLPPGIFGPEGARIAFTAVGRVTPPIAVEEASSMELSYAGVRVAPNPAPGWTRFLLEGRETLRPRILRIYDCGGRFMRMLTASTASQEEWMLWDGRDGQGRKLPAGVYFFEAEGARGPRGRNQIVIVR